MSASIEIRINYFKSSQFKLLTANTDIECRNSICVGLRSKLNSSIGEAKLHSPVASTIACQ